MQGSKVLAKGFPGMFGCDPGHLVPYMTAKKKQKKRKEKEQIGERDAAIVTPNGNIRSW